MSDSVKPPRPSEGAFDEREESSVRSRPSAPKSKSGAYPAVTQPPPSSDESIAQRTLRMDQKMEIATTRLRGMSPLDARAGLLSSAVLRRDEVLLDAILSGMSVTKRTDQGR